MKRFIILSLLLVLILSACGLLPEATPEPSVEELVQILLTSDPDSSSYSTSSKEFAEFPQSLEQLSGMGTRAVDAASVIAKAISYPRRDSYLAAEALLTLGSEIASLTIPTLLDNLNSPRAEVRMYSTFILGSIGDTASCAVAEIAPLLWDPDPFVRSAAAIALDLITGEDLVKPPYKMIPEELASISFPGDEPEGDITDPARIWWEDRGSSINWHPAYGICDP